MIVTRSAASTTARESMNEGGVTTPATCSPHTSRGRLGVGVAVDGPQRGMAEGLGLVTMLLLVLAGVLWVGVRTRRRWLVWVVFWMCAWPALTLWRGASICSFAGTRPTESQFGEIVELFVEELLLRVHDLRVQGSGPPPSEFHRSPSFAPEDCTCCTDRCWRRCSARARTGGNVTAAPVPL
jgi:hypothetical protein